MEKIFEVLKEKYGERFIDTLFKLYVIGSSGRRMKLIWFDRDIVLTLHNKFVYIYREYSRRDGMTIDWVCPKEELIKSCKEFLPKYLKLNEKIEYLLKKYNKKLLSFIFWHLVKDRNVVSASVVDKVKDITPQIEFFFEELENLGLVFKMVEYIRIGEVNIPNGTEYFLLPELIEEMRKRVSKELSIKETTVIFLFLEGNSMHLPAFKELIENILNGKFSSRFYFDKDYQQYFYSNFKSELIERKIFVEGILFWDEFKKWLNEKMENIKKEMKNIKKEFGENNIDEQLYEKIRELGHTGNLKHIFGEICTEEQFKLFAIELYKIFHEKLRNKISNRIGEIDIIRNYFAHEKYENVKERFKELCKKAINKDYPEKPEDWRILADYIKSKILEKLNKY